MSGGKSKSTERKIYWAETTPFIRSASVSSAAPGYVIPRPWFHRALVDFDFWLVRSGRVELEDRQGGVRILTRGSVVMLRPGDEFEVRVIGEDIYTNAFIHFDLLDARGNTIPYEQVELPPVIGHIHDTHYFEAAIHRLMFLHYQLGSIGSELRASARRLGAHLLAGLLHDYELHQRISEEVRLVGVEKHHWQNAGAALSWLYLHPETRLSASELAEKFGYSQRHFRRIFQQVHQKTPGQVLIEARVDHAKKLLSGSALNITEIAESLGYENVFYFSRQFRQATGLSPLQFRRQLRAGSSGDAVSDGLTDRR